MADKIIPARLLARLKHLGATEIRFDGRTLTFIDPTALYPKRRQRLPLVEFVYLWSGFDEFPVSARRHRGKLGLTPHGIGWLPMCDRSRVHLPHSAHTALAASVTEIFDCGCC
jgi:hypothetical protein